MPPRYLTARAAPRRRRDAALLLLLPSLGSALRAHQGGAADGQDTSCSGPLYAEPGRPQFHFTPAHNWMNDPNGLVFYNGEYHLFFQHNPRGVRWGCMTWGHAVSGDLLHWRELEPAIRPDEQGDIWSGSAVVDWCNTSGLQQRASEPPLVALYTNAPRDFSNFTQRLAYSLDSGRTWQRLPYPAIGAIAESRDARDPKVIWHEASRQWLLALWGTGWGRGVNSTFYLYSSKDLISWRKLQDVKLQHAGTECPDIFELPLQGGAPGETRFVFLTAMGAYSVGTFNGTTFAPSGPTGYLEYGEAYAGQTYSDEPKGRRLQLSWLGRAGSCERKNAWHGEGFTGQMTVPVELELVARPGGSGPQLRRKPAAELRSLRSQPPLLSLAGEDLPPGGDASAKGKPGAGLEARLRARPAEPGGELLLRLQLLGQDVEVRSSGRSLARRKIFKAGSVRMNEALAAAAVATIGERSVPLELDGQGAVELSIFADRHSLEVFDAVGGKSMATCFALPCDESSWSRNVTINSLNHSKIEYLEVYELKPAVPTLA